ncbi:hypothetical protein RHSIM_Rhsim08G0083300 [Rhododendron simsii]|uniref:Retrotransposon gag domain-containing protein n=1 Tax=Rhododendron simsii TaxID=118357 RepID=A0A834GST4_RHOSS|nr:hypothetical protein RHSIM_Rhsim08G0083300 [Rhododendron simsii]
MPNSSETCTDIEIIEREPGKIGSRRMATLQKFKFLATQCAVAGSPSRSPTTSPVIHLRRRKTLRMFLSRAGSASRGRDESLDHRKDNSAAADGSPEKIKQQLVVRSKLKDFFVSSPPPPLEERGTENIRERFLTREDVLSGGGVGSLGGRRGGIRPLSAAFRQRLLRRAWRPVLVAIPEFRPASKSDDSNWIDEYVYEQRTKLFETYGIIHGFECLFIMDSGSQGNYVSQKLVSFLNLPTEYLSKPYHVRWVNQGSRIPVIKRCLVEFSIGSQYWDKIWCNVLPMESYDVLLGRPWQWDTDVNYQGRKNVYELKMNGNSIKLFPTVEKMKREKLLFIAEKVIPSTQVKRKKKAPIMLFRPASNWNVEDVTLRDEVAELRQSNQTLQHTMNEILQRMQTSPGRSRRSHSRISGSQSDMDEGSDSFSSKGNSEAAFGDRWAMEQLARALEGTDRSIQVHVPDFEGKLDPDQYCDWIASLEAFFEWKDLSAERKVQFVATKLKGHALIWWQQYQRSRDRKGIPRVNTWTEMKLKLDEKFLPLDYAQTLYQKLHQLNQQSDQSVADYTEQFYQ